MPTRHFLRTALGLTCAALLLAAPASSAPLQWKVSEGGNDHFYDLVLVPASTWSEANGQAQALTNLGKTGQLASITSAGEQDFIETNLLDPIFQSGVAKFAWIGLNDLSGNDVLEWTTGEPFTLGASFDNWDTSEPNGGTNGAIDAAIHVRSDSGAGTPWRWNDMPDISDGRSVGFLAEFDAPEVPEPAALALVGLALLGGAARRASSGSETASAAPGSAGHPAAQRETR